MGPTATTTTTATGTAGMTARALTSASVMLSAVVHLELYAQGMSSVAVVGPAFLVNGFGGLVLGVALLVWRHWLPLVGAIAFGLTTLGAFIVSVTVGLFGVQERFEGVPQLLSAWSEVAAVVLAVVALVLERPGRRTQASTSQA